MSLPRACVFERFFVSEDATRARARARERERERERRAMPTWGPFADVKRHARGRAAHVAACEAFANGEYKKSIERFTEALGVDARSHFALMSRALARLRDGDREGALRDARAAVRNAPENEKAWFRFAQALKANGEVGEAMNAFREAKRRDVAAAHEKEIDEAIAALEREVENVNCEKIRACVAKSEARREADVAEEEEEEERRARVKRRTWDAKEAKRASKHEETARKLDYEPSANFKVIDTNEYDDESADSDASEMESYDGLGRALNIRRRITNFASLARRFRTSVGAKNTTDMMCELRRYGNCQIEIPFKLEAMAKLTEVADAADACELPFVVIPAWRDASCPWPMQLAAAHQSVQDVMWLLETITRVVVEAMYDDCGIPTSELVGTLDSPASFGDTPIEVSPSALVLADEEMFMTSYARKNKALARVEWLERVELDMGEFDDANVGAVIEFTTGAELARRLDGEFITVEQLHPRDREGDNVDPKTHDDENRPPRTRVSFFLCAKSSVVSSL